MTMSSIDAGAYAAWLKERERRRELERLLALLLVQGGAYRAAKDGEKGPALLHLLETEELVRDFLTAKPQ